MFARIAAILLACHLLAVTGAPRPAYPSPGRKPTPGSPHRCQGLEHLGVDPLQAEEVGSEAGDVPHQGGHPPGRVEHPRRHRGVIALVEAGHLGEVVVDASGQQFLLGRPPEHTADAVKLGVEIGPGPVLADHPRPARLQRHGAEVLGEGVAVLVPDHAQGVLQADLVAPVRLLRPAVIIAGVPPIGQDQLVDGDVRRGRGLREAPAVGLPFAQNAGVLLPALRGAERAEEEVTPVAEAVGQGDDGLTALLVEAVSGDVVAAGHAPVPFLRKTSAHSRVPGRAPDRREVRLNCVRRGSCVSGRYRT